MDPYATHLEATITCALQSGLHWPDSPILELGCGDYSTPQLAAIAKVQSRRLVVMASSHDWLERFDYLKGGQVELQRVTNAMWPRVSLGNGWGMALVDNEQRVVDRLQLVKRLSHSAHVVVLHDGDSLFDGEGVFHRLCRWFRHIHFETRRQPATVVLSNFIDPSDWFVGRQRETVTNDSLPGFARDLGKR